MYLGSSGRGRRGAWGDYFSHGYGDCQDDDGDDDANDDHISVTV